MRRTLPAAASICLSCSGLRLKHSYSFDLCDEDAADIGATPPLILANTRTFPHAYYCFYLHGVKTRKHKTRLFPDRCLVPRQE